MPRGGHDHGHQLFFPLGFRDVPPEAGSGTCSFNTLGKELVVGEGIEDFGGLAIFDLEA